MRQKAAVVVAVSLVLCLVTAKPAHALWGDGWLERLSGPGPFRGMVWDHRFLCVTLAGRVQEAEGTLSDSLTKDLSAPIGDRAWLSAVGCSGLDLPATNPHRSDPRLEIGFDLQLLHSVDNVLSYTQSPEGPAEVGLRMFAVTADVRVNRVVDVGTAVGNAWFRSKGGTSFDSFSRVVWQPLRITVRPLAFLSDRRSAEAIMLRFDATKFNGKFTAEDFGADPGTFKEPGEITWAWSIRIEPFALLK